MAFALIVMSTILRRIVWRPISSQRFMTPSSLRSRTYPPLTILLLLLLLSVRPGYGIGADGLLQSGFSTANEREPTERQEDGRAAVSLIPQIHWHVDMAFATGSAARMPMWQVSHRGGRLLDQRRDGWIGARLVTDWQHPSNRNNLHSSYPADGRGVQSNAPHHSANATSHHAGGNHNHASGTNNQTNGLGRMPHSGNASWFGTFFEEEPRVYSRWFVWKPDYRAGVEFIAKPESGESRVYEAFLQLRYGPFQLTGGRRAYTSGFAHDRLSTGSMGMSPNYAPFPRITAGIPHYVPVPFTFRYLEIKGHYSHAWLDDDRFTSDPWLHEKAVYVRTRSDWPVRLQGGFTHFAMWGGTHPELGPAPAGFNDYLRVVLGRNIDPGSDAAENFPQWAENAIGDHLGVIEFSLGWELFGMEWDAYRQIFFEDGSGMRFYHNKDGLNGLRIRPGARSGSGPSFSGGRSTGGGDSRFGHDRRGNSGTDGRGGHGDSRWVRTILVEYLKTTWQSGPGPSDPPEGPDDPFFDPDEPYFDPDYPYNFGGRDHYYNHYVYRNGWTYRNMSMGTPLLLQQDRGRFYYPDKQMLWRRFVSNRVQAWHIGAEGELSGLADAGLGPVAVLGRVLTGYRFLITRARHQGTYDNIDIFNRITDPDAPFADRPVQYHTMLELSGRLPWLDGTFTSHAASPLNDLRFTLALSLDAGELTNHTGVMLGIRWGSTPF